MFGRKAEYLAQFGAERGLGFVRFDYRGHGDSTGRLEDGSIEQWLADAEAVIELAAAPSYIAIGASMGAWIALLLARRRRAHLAGIVGVGAAPDGLCRLAANLSAEQRAALAADGVFYRPSRYGDGPYPITSRMLEAAASHQVLAGDWRLCCPLILLHGVDDPDVPWEHAAEALQRLDCEKAELRLRKGGDHRLSDPADLLAIGRCVDELLEDCHDAKSRR